MIQLHQQLEHKLKLPVVFTQSGTVYVLDAFGKNAEVLAAGRRSTSKFLRRREKTPERRQLSIKLSLRYPDVPLEAANSCLGKIGSIATKVQAIHIVIETGVSAPDWARLERYITALMSNMQNKYKIPSGITIDGVFARPGRRHVDWLAKHRIVARYVLGPALGYAGNLDGKTSKVLKAMSDEGLRVPVLFYWSGQDGVEVKEVLSRALRLNKFAGVGILPCFLSPRFDSQTSHNHGDSEGFSDVVGSLYADRLLCEHLDEPIGDIEQRLAGAPGANCVRGLITEDGELLSFRHFPFAANHRSVKSSRSPASQLNVPMCERCRRCAWRHICGGVDAAPPGLRQQHKIIADAWCQHRRILMRRITAECLEIREHLNQFKGRLPRSAKK
jgi:hypothetical protein